MDRRYFIAGQSRLRTVARSIGGGIAAILLAATIAPSEAAAQQTCGSAGCPRYPTASLTPGTARAATKTTICTTSTKVVRNVPAQEKRAVFSEYGFGSPATRAVVEYLIAPHAPLSGAIAVEEPNAIEALTDPNAPGKPGPGGAEFEVDHFIPLELGGSNDLLNLWPESYVMPWGAHIKDALEDRLHRMVCANDISLADAQSAIRTDWIAAYKKYVATPALHR